MKKLSVILTLSFVPTFLYASQTPQDISRVSASMASDPIFSEDPIVRQKTVQQLEGAVLSYKGMYEWERDKSRKKDEVLLDLHRELAERINSEREMYDQAHYILEENTQLKRLSNEAYYALAVAQFELDATRKELDNERSLRNHTCTERANAKRRVKRLQQVGETLKNQVQDYKLRWEGAEAALTISQKGNREKEQEIAALKKRLAELEETQGQ